MRDPSDPWQDEHAARTPTPQIGPTTAELKRQAIETCGQCDKDGYAGTTVCDHQAGHREAARRGMAAIRAAMGWQPTTPHQAPENRSEQRTAPANSHPSPTTPPRMSTKVTQPHQHTTSTPT